MSEKNFSCLRKRAWGVAGISSFGLTFLGGGLFDDFCFPLSLLKEMFGLF